MTRMKKGKLIGEPIRGAHVDEYRSALDDALEQFTSLKPGGKIL